MESDGITIIGINPESGNNRANQVTADIFYNGIKVTEARLGIDIETVFVLFIDGSFCFLKEEPMCFSISLRRAVWKALRR